MRLESSPETTERSPKPFRGHAEDAPQHGEPEHWDPLQVMHTRENVMENYRAALRVAGRDKEPILVEKMKGDIQNIEKNAVREGVDFSKAQLNLFANDYLNGMRTEFESVSPYLADYDLKNGVMWGNNLTHHDAVGLAIAKRLRQMMPDARMISLYDEYNTAMPDSSTVFGTPEANAPQMVLSDEVKQNFKEDLKRVFTEAGIIGEEDKENESYLLISESEKIKDAEVLVQLLDEKGAKDGQEYIRRDGEGILFVNPDMSNPAYKEITLRSKSGRWMCEALDASSYVKPENKDMAHLVILPAAFRVQQDKVWEVLRVLGILPTNYHNIFYEPSVDPARTAELIAEELAPYLSAPKAETVH